MIKIQFVYLGLILAPLVAGLSSLIVESPYGGALRKWLAGEGRASAVVREPDGSPLLLPPDRPWLSEALQCVGCVSFWVATGLYLYVAPRPWPWLETGIGIGCSWLLARLILGLARLMEYHGGE